VLRQHVEERVIVASARPLSDPPDSRRGAWRVDTCTVTILRREMAGLGGVSLEWLPAPPVLDRALPAPPQTSSIPAASWSPGQALVVVLIAMGALAFFQIFLYAVHVPAGQVSGALWTIGAGGLFFVIARVAAMRLGGPDGVAAIGMRMPKVVDLVVGLAAGVGLYFANQFVSNWVFVHLDGWVGWYPIPPALELASGGPWIALGLIEVVVVAIGEESMFRGIMYRGLRTRYPVALAVASSAAIFAFVHSYPPSMPAILLGGVVLALATEWRKSLALAIVIHAVYDGCFVVQGFLT
jgi:membrane protease YdiL (CAAX protease family)